jgi:hypothetical protein
MFDEYVFAVDGCAVDGLAGVWMGFLCFWGCRVGGGAGAVVGDEVRGGVEE